MADASTGPESDPGGSAPTCPGCGSTLSPADLAQTDYRCGQCGLEVAHLETTALGTTRRVIRWLRRPGDVVLDRYRIEKVLGKGGFAATYLVHDLRVQGKKRALKEIPEVLYDATETELLGHLNHPAIPDITDQARSDEMVYLVLELGGGNTLETERKLAGGKVPLARVLAWLTQLGAALSYLHSQKPPIIHRDLKPENILLDDHGRVMLIDFGIAKQSADDGRTRALARAATHGFSPPEQAMGTGTDPRSDVYSLAATVYALLTGRVPTPAHERIAGQELADPSALAPDLPPGMATGLMQGLSLNINQRPGTVEEFLRAMGLSVAPTSATAATTRTVMVGDLTATPEAQATSVRIRSERLTVGPSPPAVRKGSGKSWQVLAGVAVLAIAGSGYWLYALKEPAGPPASSGSPVDQTRAAATPGPPPQPSIAGVPPPAAAPLAVPGAPSPGPIAVPGPPPPPLATTAPQGAMVPSPPAGLPEGIALPSAAPGAASAPPATAGSSVPLDASSRGIQAPPGTESAAAAPLVRAEPPGMAARPAVPPAVLTPATPAETSTSSALDAFEQHRSSTLSAEPAQAAAEPQAPTEAEPPKEPRRKSTATAKKKEGGSSGWGGFYIGGGRRDP